MHVGVLQQRLSSRHAWPEAGVVSQMLGVAAMLGMRWQCALPDRRDRRNLKGQQNPGLPGVSSLMHASTVLEQHVNVLCRTRLCL